MKTHLIFPAGDAVEQEFAFCHTKHKHFNKGEAHKQTTKEITVRILTRLSMIKYNFYCAEHDMAIGVDGMVATANDINESNVLSEVRFSKCAKRVRNEICFKRLNS